MRRYLYKIESSSLPRCDIKEYSKLDIENFMCDKLPKIARKPKETWKKFNTRKYNAEKKLDTFVFGGFNDGHFDVAFKPEGYDDYQIAKRSEFGIVASSTIGKISISINDEEMMKFFIENSKESINNKELIRATESANATKFVKSEFLGTEKTYEINYINKNAIGQLFKYWKLKEELLNNTRNYLKASCDENGCIDVYKWLTSTGKKGRTKELESLTEGTSLSYSAYRDGCSGLMFNILSPNGTIVGEVNWKTEELYDDELYKVFIPLIDAGYAHIESIKLNKLIPHKTPGGRQLKALAQVILAIKIDELPGDVFFFGNVNNDIQSMRTLAAIDYNRKCNIIDGVIPERIDDIKDIFCDGEIESCEFITEIPLRRGNIDLISGVNLSNEELEEFWNVYQPTQVYLDMEAYLKEDDSPNRERESIFYCKRQHLSFSLEFTYELMQVAEELLTRERIVMKIFRNNLLK